MPRLAVLLIVCFLSPLAAGQEGSPDHAGEIYALASGGTGGIDTSDSFAGFSAGGAWQPSPRFSVVADFGRLFAADTHARFNTFMTGPRIYSADHDGLAGFIQFRAGAQQTNMAGKIAWGTVWGPGAGVDIHLAGRLVWRAIEVNVTLGDKSSQAGPGIRYASGFALRLGN